MEPEDFKEIDGLKPGDMSRLNLSWWEKLKLKYFPMSFLFDQAKDRGAGKILDKPHEAFTKAKTVELIPIAAARGFIIVIDRKISFWFYQDGDHFKYDGFEIGEYDKGDVTIFDKIDNS